MTVRNRKEEKCPYCGGSINTVSSTAIYGEGHNYGLMKTCANWPACDSYCGNGSTLANRELRELRKKCHRLFDVRWKSGQVSRKYAYKWLREIMNLGPHDAHISLFDVPQCKQLLELLLPPSPIKNVIKNI